MSREGARGILLEAHLPRCVRDGSAANLFDSIAEFHPRSLGRASRSEDHNETRRPHRNESVALVLALRDQHLGGRRPKQRVLVAGGLDGFVDDRIRVGDASDSRRFVHGPKPDGRHVDLVGVKRVAFDDAEGLIDILRRCYRRRRHSGFGLRRYRPTRTERNGGAQSGGGQREESRREGKHGPILTGSNVAP